MVFSFDRVAGLPIEIKALEAQNKSKKKSDSAQRGSYDDVSTAVTTRTLAAEFARKAIEVQKKVV